MTMSKYSIALAAEIPGELAEEFAERVYYVSSAIRDYHLLYGAGGGVRGVEVTADAEADESELARRLNVVAQRDVLPQRNAHRAEAVVWQSMALPRASRIRFADLERAGLAAREGEGTYTVSGPLADLLAGIDRRVRTIAADLCDAVETRYPALIPTEVLARAGYFDAFPQFLMTAGRLRSDVDGYDRFAPEFAAAPDRARFLHERAGHAGYCLSPTVCHHTFQQFAGRELPEAGAAVTACGRVFRFESRYQRTLERLWDFTLREVVFLGSRESVVETRRRLMEAICTWVDRLRLAGQLELADDRLFGTGATARRARVQRALKLKFTLRMPVVEDRSIAVGSFSVHGSKFGEAFGIALPGGAPAYTGCLGIGLERFAYAFLCRHGLDPSDWPEIGVL